MQLTSGCSCQTLPAGDLQCAILWTNCPVLDQRGQPQPTRGAGSHTCYRPRGKLLKQQDTPHQESLALPGIRFVGCNLSHCAPLFGDKQLPNHSFPTDCMLPDHKSKSDKRRMCDSGDPLHALLDTELIFSLWIKFAIHLLILLHPYHHQPDGLVHNLLPISLLIVWNSLMLRPWRHAHASRSSSHINISSRSRRYYHI